jgi:uncharacterized membrane protein YhaH (DUF805 family)
MGKVNKIIAWLKNNPKTSERQKYWWQVICYAIAGTALLLTSWVMAGIRYDTDIVFYLFNAGFATGVVFTTGVFITVFALENVARRLWNNLRASSSKE